MRGAPLTTSEVEWAGQDELESKTAKDFSIRVRNKRTGHEWVERYQKETDSPEQWGRDIIKFWNSTVRPGEDKREFLGVELHGEIPPPEHRWAKVTLMTQEFRGSPVDKMQCERCQITGKRFGLLPNIKRDSQFRAKVYARCDTTMKHLAEKQQTR